jgi:aspartate carbamoyltransferase regulatory subunit
VQPLKSSKELVDVGHIKTGAVITHVKGGLALRQFKATKLNLGVYLFGSELPSVVEQVFEGDAPE